MGFDSKHFLISEVSFLPAEVLYGTFGILTAIGGMISILKYLPVLIDQLESYVRVAPGYAVVDMQAIDCICF